jgi:osmotically-inducible protein OsmY
MDDDLADDDRQVLMLIRRTLLDYEPLRATRPVLDVSYRDGLVALAGRVRTSAIKEIAELLVLHLPGVRAVRNDLVADPEVVRAVADALAADPELGPACPIVESRDGVVILVGSVPSEEAALRAVQITNTVPIIASVTSYLKVAPPVVHHSVNGSSNGAVAVATAEDGESA